MLLIVFAACRKEKINPDFTRVFTIHSKIKDRDYRIKVQLPEDYDPASEKYASMYMLDAFRSTVKDFAFVSKTCTKLAEEQHTLNVIVVGIDYGDAREDDYTPAITEGNGGDDARFADFIEKELQPANEHDFAGKGLA
jgi:predicted alpha/beta superfamily hydrolase